MQDIPRGYAHESRLVALPLMSAFKDLGSEIDRASEMRDQPEKLESLWESADILHICQGAIATEANRLKFLASGQLPEEFLVGERYFLGLNKKTGRAYFAWNTDLKITPTAASSDFKTLREIGNHLDSLETDLAMHAIGLANWHLSHPQCSKCGEETKVDLGGAMRTCISCQGQHHPRTDPAVIVLVKDATDRILLGRQAVWPEGRYSNFAGFVEPGESFENCVIREVLEESGVDVSEIKYLMSQPWPFPASIMVAFEAITNNPTDARPDGTEIVDLKWFSREEMKSAIAVGKLLLPPAMSVARKMITTWYCKIEGFDLSDLGGGESWRP